MTAEGEKHSKARVVRRSRNYRQRRCPRCGRPAPRHSLGKRRVHDLSLGQKSLLEITYSKHYCRRCKNFFNAPMQDLAPVRSSYTTRVCKVALARVLEDELHIKVVQRQMQRDFHVNLSSATIYRWINRHLLGQP